jgi:hypothetical protein
MRINNIKSIQINKKEYWTVKQFSLLTEKSISAIRVLMHKGNRIRKLKYMSIGGKPFIEAEELFNYPFVVKGRPAEVGSYIEKFYLENDELIKNEEVYNEAEENTDG